LTLSYLKAAISNISFFLGRMCVINLSFYSKNKEKSLTEKKVG